MVWKLRQMINNYRAGIQVRAQEEADAELKKHQQIGAVEVLEILHREAQTGKMRLTQEELDAAIEAATT